MKCRICNFEFTPSIIDIFERMYGSKAKYHYAQCSKCQCLQIIDLPEDLRLFYPNTSYYSFQKKPYLKQLVRRAWIYAQSPFQNNKWNLPKLLLGLVWKQFRGRPPLLDWLEAANLKKNASILDVGCGAGIFIYDLQDEPFPIVNGIEPFISQSVTISAKSSVYKTEIKDCNQQYDFIMLNHSLEHIADQQQIFRELSRVLSDDGTLMIRIPVIDSALWKEYGIDWVNLDAPRHLYLHSPKSIELLANAHGMKLFKTSFDSDEFGIWGSIHYKNGGALIGNDGQSQVQAGDLFSAAQLKEFRLKAQQLNNLGQGDQACFYFRKIR